MTSLLLHLFVKDHQNIADPRVRTAIGKLAGVTGILCNIILTAAKLTAAIPAGSVAMLADAMNNLTDIASSAVTFFGFRLAQRPADKDHPYGHARYEYVSGLVIAMLIFLVGAELLGSSLKKIIHPSPLHVTPAAIVILVGSILMKLWMTLFMAKIGKKLNSVTILAASADSRNDVIATSAVLLVCLANVYFHLNLDGYIGVLVALFILFSGVKTAQDTVSPLLGKQVDKKTEDEISRIILAHDRILGIHDLLVHDYGPGHCYASVHAEFSAEEDPLLCHDTIDEIECTVSEKLNVNLVIHYDPVVKNDPEQNAMSALIQDAVRAISPQISMHDFRIARGSTQVKLIFDLSIPYALFPQRAAIKKSIEEALASHQKEYTVVIRFDGIA